MKLFADYHTHTVYSHGKGTIRENVEEAMRKGLKEIVISDHGPGHFTYGVKIKNIKKMREEIEELKKEYNNIDIKLGVEANLISCDGDLDVKNDYLYVSSFFDIKQGKVNRRLNSGRLKPYKKD
jgi:putative hydrolase